MNTSQEDLKKKILEAFATRKGVRAAAQRRPHWKTGKAIHAKDPRKAMIDDGETVRVSTGRGAARVTRKVSDRVRDRRAAAGHPHGSRENPVFRTRRVENLRNLLQNYLMEKKGRKGKMPKMKMGIHKSRRGGLKQAGVDAYRRANPGSKLKMAVTTKPSKLKKGSKDAKRRKSFCSRMGGMKSRLTSAKTARDPNSRINKALRKWNCNSNLQVDGPVIRETQSKLLGFGYITPHPESFRKAASAEKKYGSSRAADQARNMLRRLAKNKREANKAGKRLPKVKLSDLKRGALQISNLKLNGPMVSEILPLAALAGRAALMGIGTLARAGAAAARVARPVAGLAMRGAQGFAKTVNTVGSTVGKNTVKQTGKAAKKMVKISVDSAKKRAKKKLTGMSSPGRKTSNGPAQTQSSHTPYEGDPAVTTTNTQSSDGNVTTTNKNR
jgi:hypothetical protein